MSMLMKALVKERVGESLQREKPNCVGEREDCRIEVLCELVNL